MPKKAPPVYGGSGADLIVLQAAVCCQMSDNPRGKPNNIASEVEGYGSGGNRCTEACTAMIDFTYKLGPMAQDGAHRPEDAMFQFTEERNAGSDTSAPQNGQWVADWVAANGKGITMQSIGTDYQSLCSMVERGHIAMAGFSDYNKLAKVDGSSAYSWHDPDGDGHVLIVVGFCRSRQSVYVHDPLQGETKQPMEYSFASFQRARFDYLGEVNGPSLPIKNQVGGTMTPQGPFVSVTAGQNGVESSGNAIAAHFGLSWQDILAIPGQNPGLKNYDPSGPTLVGANNYGVTLLVPGYTPVVQNQSKQIADLSAQIDQLNHSVASLSAENAGLKNQIEADSVVSGGANKTIGDLRKQLAEANARHASALDEIKQFLSLVVSAFQPHAAVHSQASSLLDKVGK